MSQTVSTIEVEVSKLAGDYFTGSASGNGAAGGGDFPTTSEDIASRPAQNWQPHTVEITSGTYDGAVRPVSSTSQATGVITINVLPVFAGQILSGVTFRMHRFPRLWKIQAISSALEEITDVMPRIITEEFLSGQLLRNGMMEQWRGNTPYDWEIVSGTVTKETSTVYEGVAALKFAAVASDNYVRQLIVPSRDLRDETIYVQAFGNGGSTNGPYVAILDGVTRTSGAAATIANWQELTVTSPAINGRRPVYIELHKGTSNTATYFDHIHCKIVSQTGTSVIPISEAFRTVHTIEARHGIDQAAATLQSELDYAVNPYGEYPMPQTIHGGYGHYRRMLPRDEYMRAIGVGMWPTVDDDADTVDITLDQVPLVAGRAAIKLLERVLSDGSYGNREEMLGALGRLRSSQVTKERLLSVQPPVRRLTLPLR